MTFCFNSTKGGSLALLALTAALLQPAAYAQSTAKPGSEPVQSGKSDLSPMLGGAMDMKGMDMKAMMEHCQEQMSSMKMSGNPDVDFAKMMRMHHQGAIDMANAEMRDGKDAQMRKIATDTIATQKKELARQDAFLAN